MTCTHNENLVINRKTPGAPLEVNGESDLDGGTIIACRHFTSDGETSPEFTGYRARGTKDSPVDIEPGDEILKIAAVGRGNGIWQQAGFIQWVASGGWSNNSNNDAPSNLEIALSPNDSDAPVLRMLLTADGTIEVFGDLEIPNNTMFWSKTLSGGRLGMMYLSENDETTMQLNNANIVFSDALTETDQSGNTIGIKATVNGKSGYIPFVEN